MPEPNVQLSSTPGGDAPRNQSSVEFSGAYPASEHECEPGIALCPVCHPLLAARLKWEAENPRPEPLVRAERAIVRALRDAGFGQQSQVTHGTGFDIATDAIVVRVGVNPATWPVAHDD